MGNFKCNADIPHADACLHICSCSCSCSSISQELGAHNYAYKTVCKSPCVKLYKRE